MEMDAFVPWIVIPECRGIMEYVKQHWEILSLHATSIGAYFSMLAFTDTVFQTCLFLSPIVDMEQLIKDMMQWAHVNENDVEKQGTIETSFGQTLSWEYLTYARQHPITSWSFHTHILYGMLDTMCKRTTLDPFVKQFSCDLCVVEDGEHWFHTEKQWKILQDWYKKNV